MALQNDSNVISKEKCADCAPEYGNDPTSA
jgi:hypothetical protein